MNSLTSLGVYSINLKYNLPNFFVEFLCIPYFTNTKLPLPGSIWGGEAYNIDSNITQYEIDASLPSFNLSNMEYAARISMIILNFDLAFLFYDMYERKPVFLNKIDMMNNRMETKAIFARKKAIGTCFNIIFNKIALYSELLYQFEKDFIIRDEELDANLQMEDTKVSKDVFTYVVGIDSDFFNISNLHWYFEFYNSIIINYINDLTDNSGKVEENIYNFFFRLEDTYFSDTLNISISVLYFYNDDGFIIIPTFKYLISDELSLKIGSNIFIKGNQDTGVAAFYDKNDNIFFQLKYSY